MYSATSSLNGLRDQAKANEHLRNALRNASTAEEIVNIATNNGFTLTVGDINSVIRDAQYPTSTLEIAELEAVANNASTNTGTCGNSCGCNSTETCSNCCRR